MNVFLEGQIPPIYSRLASDAILAGYTPSKSQNADVRLHSFIRAKYQEESSSKKYTQLEVVEALS